MSTSTRRLEILRAIVDEYVATQEPVGSKAIADRHELGVSPATIRNEMALLEEEGLITAPHTSAGRIQQIVAIEFSSTSWQRLNLYPLQSVAPLNHFLKAHLILTML